MTKDKAFELRDKLLRMIRAEGQWVTLSEERKPDAKIIKLEMSIRIGTDK